MKWEVLQAKNGESTLRLNDIFIYSYYKPYEDAKRWISSECDFYINHYVLIGLGLGYHLKALVETTTDQQITVYYFENRELQLFLEKNEDEEWWRQKRIKIVNHFENVQLKANELQFLLPQVWIKAIGVQHPLYNNLEIIRNNQIVYKKFAKQMEFNFKNNLFLKDDIDYPKKQNNIACLVAAGPSLDETISWLKEIKDLVDIYVVGAVLKKLEREGISPKATIISDANDIIQFQLENCQFNGPLYYLSTANHNAVKSYNGPRYIVFQEGYKNAEAEARKRNCTTLQTGGSVSTTLFSLLELLEYEKIILFGQDLGFIGEKSHATHSNSTELLDGNNIRTVKSNSGMDIKSPLNLYAFLQWFNLKVKTTKASVYNTAKFGAEIDNVPYIDKKKLLDVVLSVEDEV